MTLPAHIRFSRREQWAIAVTLLTLIIGLWLGFRVDPAWVSRFGALIIIVGVVFAVSDLPTLLENRARHFESIVSALTFNQFIHQMEDEHGTTLNDTDIANLRRQFEQLTEAEVNRRASLPKRRFLVVEAVIICVGTFVNGFGEWLASFVCGI